MCQRADHGKAGWPGMPRDASSDAPEDARHPEKHPVRGARVFSLFSFFSGRESAGLRTLRRLGMPRDASSDAPEDARHPEKHPVRGARVFSLFSFFSGRESAGLRTLRRLGMLRMLHRMLPTGTAGPTTRKRSEIDTRRRFSLGDCFALRRVFFFDAPRLPSFVFSEKESRTCAIRFVSSATSVFDWSSKIGSQSNGNRWIVGRSSVSFCFLSFHSSFLFVCLFVFMFQCSEFPPSFDPSTIYRVLVDCRHFYWLILGFTGFDRACAGLFLGLTWFYWVLLGFTVFF